MGRHLVTNLRRGTCAGLDHPIRDAGERRLEVAVRRPRRGGPLRPLHVRKQVRPSPRLAEEGKPCRTATAGEPLHLSEAVDPSVAVAIHGGSKRGRLRSRRARERGKAGQPGVCRRRHRAVVDLRAWPAAATRHDHIVDLVGVVAARGHRHPANERWRERRESVDLAGCRPREIVDLDHRLHARAGGDRKFGQAVGLRAVHQRTIDERADVGKRKCRPAEGTATEWDKRLVRRLGNRAAKRRREEHAHLRASRLRRGDVRMAVAVDLARRNRDAAEIRVAKRPQPELGQFAEPGVFLYAIDREHADLGDPPRPRSNDDLIARTAVDVRHGQPRAAAKSLLESERLGDHRTGFRLHQLDQRPAPRADVATDRHHRVREHLPRLEGLKPQAACGRSSAASRRSIGRTTRGHEKPDGRRRADGLPAAPATSAVRSGIAYGSARGNFPVHGRHSSRIGSGMNVSTGITKTARPRAVRSVPRGRPSSAIGG